MNKIILKKFEHLSIEENKKLLSIRNKEDIRNQSLNKSIIDLNSHLKWLENLKGDLKKEYYAIIHSGQIVGAINFFEVNSTMKWGVYFKEEVSLLVKSLVPIYFIEYIFKKTQVEFLYLDILKNNLNAISFDKNFGFYFFQENNDYFTMRVSSKEFKKAKEKKLLKRVVKKMSDYSFIME